MSNAVEIEDPVIGIPSPGTLLAAKREEYGWSVKDVAGAMRLSVQQVEAIERDDYDNLPGKTYVMGYWRSYSQLLKISIDDSIQVHRAELSSDVREIVLEPSHKQVRGSEEKSRKIFALLFACLLAVFLAAVWYWQDPDTSVGNFLETGLSSLNPDNVVEDSPQTAIEALSPQVPPLAPMTDQSVLALPEPNFAGDQQAVDINTRGYEVLVTELPISRPDLTYRPWSESPLAAREAEQQAAKAAEAAAAAESSAADTAVVNDTTTTAATTTTSLNAGDAAAADKTPSAARAESARQAQALAAAKARVEAQRKAATIAANPDRVISFQLTRESWIDVRDSTGERLIYRTVNSGENIQLTGMPPYSVFLGSAEGVNIQYQGKPVQFKIHESGLFARFVVGNQQ